MSSIAVHPIAGPLGAEISGVDLGADLDEATIADIRRAWLEHLVIFFRDRTCPRRSSWPSRDGSASPSSTRS